MSEFTVYAALDLRRGRVVRLRQGDASAETVYADDTASAAARWEAQGARWLHVVNLDGAFDDADGTNTHALAKIRAAVKIPIQYGGGLRSRASLARAFESGAQRVVIGTMAVEQPHLVAQGVDEFGAERIAVAMDLEGDRLATHGWRAVSSLQAGAFAAQMRGFGIVRAVVTDIARDGMLCGIDAARLARFARESGLGIIAAGGVASVEDIRACAAFVREGIEGVIVGTALYTGAVKLEEIARVWNEAEGDLR
ncbi:MAG TPA: HisA/HisF-related TIM barrel protein [Anaerolineae bacterium]